MNSDTPVSSQYPIDVFATPAPSAPRPLFWSIRREIWENRSLTIAPLIVAAVVLLGSFIGTITLPKRIRAAESAKQHSVLVTPYSMAPAPIMLATFIIGLFYSVDALYGERRDRSILFWKSLPVSDAMTVASKALVPFLVLPVIAIVLSVVVQTLLMLLGVPIFLAHGMSPTLLWREFDVIQDRVIMIYGMGAHVLWFSPIYAWLLLISAWARRAPVIWAILPPMALMALERMAFNTFHFGNFLKYRVIGAMSAAFTAKASKGNVHDLADLDPLKFLSSPGLWSGLIFAALFLVAAVRLRRNREPI